MILTRAVITTKFTTIEYGLPTGDKGDAVELQSKTPIY
jgi:hypothetical protein